MQQEQKIIRRLNLLIWDGIKKGRNFTTEQKASSKRSIIRFVIGVAIGLYTGIAVMYALSGVEHKRMNDLLKKHGIEHKHMGE